MKINAEIQNHTRTAVTTYLLINKDLRQNINVMSKYKPLIIDDFCCPFELVICILVDVLSLL